MAKLVVEMKSKHMIKPSSPTPNHLKTVQFSFVDQLAPTVNMPSIYFYPCPPNSIGNSQTTMLLKQSLSETLVEFYPLAGRIEGNLSVNCNDEGVAFYEANVLASLIEVIHDPNNPEELIKLLPFPPVHTDKSVVAGVQVNHFSCGGMAVSVSISHKIADGATIIAFINAWAANCRGDSKNENAPGVEFKSASIFPQIDLDGIYDSEGGICKEKIVTRRLMFDREKLDSLREQAVDGPQCPQERDPTRVELVSAFLWKQFIKAARAKPTPPKILSASQVVNLRTIKSSPIPGNFCGNLLWSIFAHAPVEIETTYHELVGKMRTAAKEVDTSYVEKIQTGECLLEFQKAFESFGKGEANSCGISSCTRFPVYEVDFGWGKPVWVSTTSLPFKNTVFLFSTKCGEGIEAWVNLLQEDVDIFDQDPEFISLASSHNIRAKL